MSAPSSFRLLSVLAFCSMFSPFAAAQSCENLRNFSLANVEVNSTEQIAAGAFSPPGSDSNAANSYDDLPAFCRVNLTLTPTPDSDIKMELWLPADWNGKYLAVGNAAFTGFVRHSAMTMPLGRGYATSSTDTGHLGNTASFALGHPQKVYDFAWRSVHEMAATSKALIDAYYDNSLQYSYFTGCSAGGRQAMKEAQRFPADFDGIVAGAPGLNWTGRAAAALRIEAHLQTNTAARLLQYDRELLHQTALDFCDADDGVVDGVIGNPAQCSFDPEVLECGDENAGACLSPEKVNTARMIYSSPLNPRTSRAITGLLPGSELGWTDLGWTQSARATGLDQFRYLVYEDENWTIDQFNFEPAISAGEKKDDDTVNALNPDLFEFFEAGGKLLAYHGWSDPQISPANTTQYYERVSGISGGREAIHDSLRLFMAPGMGHCGGGPGPNSFDSLSALENWVERGQAPDRLEAEHVSNGVVDRRRPLCPFPEVAVYDGSGSTDETENFVCRAP